MLVEHNIFSHTGFAGRSYPDRFNIRAPIMFVRVPSGIMSDGGRSLNQQIVVANNTIDDTATYGMYIGDSKDITIRSNQFSKLHQRIPSDNQAISMFIEPGTTINVTADNNVIN